ncbi:MAG: protein-L-isoaspartate(D-aspartate) O-methyltransferase [Candidatus Brocadiaceae bacterium]|nr:protein-L-isoaspartate(D-aspartate) O-methyltransferase [Candidatus Brocadiaceae bacterium]
MKIIALLITVIIVYCVLYTYRPFMNFTEKDAIAMGKGSIPTEEDFALKRRRMVEQQIKARGVTNKPVLEAMEKVPRHMFVPENYKQFSYYDQPLPIGQGQTISQPYIVALMTELLNVGKDDIVLEIGTGSGYQAAVLSIIIHELYTIEIVEELGVQAREQLKDLGYDNVNVRIGDGSLGWPGKAPFDAIIVTAAAEKIPELLVEQLKPGGRMVIPVDNISGFQDLMIVDKDKAGNVITKKTIPVMFVPFVEGQEIVK